MTRLEYRTISSRGRCLTTGRRRRSAARPPLNRSDRRSLTVGREYQPLNSPIRRSVWPQRGEKHVLFILRYASDAGLELL
jgi:hypothetical protein